MIAIAFEGCLSVFQRNLNNGVAPVRVWLKKGGVLTNLDRDIRPVHPYHVSRATTFPREFEEVRTILILLGISRAGNLGQTAEQSYYLEMMMTIDDGGKKGFLWHSQVPIANLRF